MSVTVHFTSSQDTFKRCECGLPHVLREPSIRVLPAPSSDGSDEADETYFDYERQAWVDDGKYVRCGHTTPCQCYGTLHEGEPALPPKASNEALFMVRCVGDGSNLVREGIISHLPCFSTKRADFFTEAEANALGFPNEPIYVLVPVSET